MGGVNAEPVRCETCKGLGYVRDGEAACPDCEAGKAWAETLMGRVAAWHTMIEPLSQEIARRYSAFAEGCARIFEAYGKRR